MGVSLMDSLFSETYAQAKERFLAAAAAADAQLYRYAVQAEAKDELSIDVAIIGPQQAPTLITSSGVHGVEGFLGSAIQLAQLQTLSDQRPCDIRWVFVHAVNPWGFASVRRFNEHNVDLNRNFLEDASDYRGAPPHYRRLNGFLNPPTAPPRFELFRLRALWNILRFGEGALKQSIAQGQYEFPQGLFFGGAGPSQSQQIIHAEIDDWVGSAERILHVDFHSGLGEHGDCKLLLAEHAGSPQCRWYEDVFGREMVEATEVDTGTAYRASGPMGEWLQRRFHERDYRFVTAEYGTWGPVRVLASLRAENRAHHFSQPGTPPFARAKQELMECFCPADPEWRAKVVTIGQEILAKGAAALAAAET